MENDEKRKKVIDELERRKGIVESYLDSIDNSCKDFDPYRYAIHKVWYQLIDAALIFVRDNFFDYNECDYSNDESYRESIYECCEKSSLLTYRIANSNFCYVTIYIGKVIDDINNNYYPANYSKIFKEIGW